MTYLNPKDLNTGLKPGQPLGDAKTFETRGVPIEVNQSGFPVKNLQKGSVVYIDNNGYAVPFSTPSTDYTNDARPTPYGVVYLVDAKTQNGTPTDITPHSNEVKVVVEGVVPVKMLADQIEPHIGQMVNPYGGAMTVTGSGPAMQPLGICDGVEKLGTDVHVAVRLTPGSGVHSNELHTPRFIKCKNADEHEIAKFDAVYLTGDQVKYSDDYIPKVAKAEPGSNHTILGFAWCENNAAVGAELPVLYFGVGYFPYILASNPAVAKLTSENGGKMPSRVPLRLIRTNGPPTNIWAILAVVLPAIGLLINTGLTIYHEVQDSKAPGKVAEVVPKETAKYRALRKAEGDGVFDVEPDGYLGVFVNPGINTPAPVTGHAVLLEPEGEKSKNLLIREGKCYVGSAEGVRPYDEEKGDTPESVTFYGVAAAPMSEDDETNLPESLIRCIRDGHANMRPYYEPGWKEKWMRGRLVEISGKVIDPADEEFVPHIGKVIEDAPTDANEEGNWLGMVDIRPFNPNQYIIVDHCKLMQVPGQDEVGPGTTVYVLVAMTSDFVKTNISFAGELAAHPVVGVRGVLVRYDENFYGTGDYYGRAVIQISGYVRCSSISAESVTAGMLVQYMKNRTAYLLEDNESAAGKCANILGTLIRSDPTADGSNPHWWVMLAPRTQYVPPLSVLHAGEDESFKKISKMHLDEE